MTPAMNDQQIQDRIERLEQEERELRADEERLSGQTSGDRLAGDRGRLERIRVELDQLWDLLRRRRALRDAGQDPNAAQLRDQGTVEGYLG
jgi:hypothetical protein